MLKYGTADKPSILRSFVYNTVAHPAGQRLFRR
jgi:hypothetical protein